MAERQPPFSRGSGDRCPTSSRERGEYQQPAGQSRNTFRPPVSQSREGYRQPAPQNRNGSRQSASQSRDGYRQSAPQGRDSSRQPAPRSSADERPRRQAPSRRNDVIRCENCGEDYSVTYKRCPFCDERPSRGGVSGRRVANTRGGGYGRPASALRTATWIGSFVVVIAAMVIIYRFMGAPLFGGSKDPGSASGSQNPGGSTSVSNPVDPDGSGGDSSTPPAAPAVESIALSRTEITLNPGASEQLIAALLPEGAAGEVTWSSSDEAAATVDAAGNVTNVNTGSSNTQVTITAVCGDISAEATVYCKPSGGGGTSGDSQRGRVVANGGASIRSGPGTDYDKVASAANGATVTILGEENGWYKVAYKSNATGYIRKDLISIG